MHVLFGETELVLSYAFGQDSWTYVFIFTWSNYYVFASECIIIYYLFKSNINYILKFHLRY